jgi:acyl-coenzyme A thioesterase PaaI-like protein
MVTGMALIEAIRSETSDPPSGILTLGLGGTHRWLETLGVGRAVFHWPVDDAHLNLEGAVICSWIAALGDQALFFAATSVCGDGEGTRMAEFTTRTMANVTGGTLVIDARINRRVGDRLYGRCTFTSEGDLAAEVYATIDVISAG